MQIVDQIRRIGWLAIEVGFILVALCVLLSIILGDGGGPFVSSVAQNATKFLQAMPPGVTLGVVLIVFLYVFTKTRTS